jgi:hypothetical protein
MTGDQVGILFLVLLALWGGWMAVFTAMVLSRLGSLGEHLSTLDRRAQAVEDTFRSAEASFAHSAQSFQNLISAVQDVENLRQVSIAVDQACTQVRDTHQAIDSQVASTGEVVQALHGLVARWSEEGAELRQCYEGMAGIFEEFLTRVESDRLRQQTVLEQLAAERSLGREEARA